MTQLLCVTTVFEPEVWDNESEAASGANPTRPLTRSSESTREGLAMKTTRPCSIDGCDRTMRKRGMCDTCYARLRWRGEIELLPTRSLAERLAAGLERKPNGCLEWTGARDPHEYGRISIGRRRDGHGLTHRVAWILANGPIPEGIQVRHFVCDNPPCCDVTHLRLGTNTQNMADMRAKGRSRTGESNGAAHVDDERVIEARRRVANGERSGHVAAEMGVAKSTMSRWINGHARAAAS